MIAAEKNTPKNEKKQGKTLCENSIISVILYLFLSITMCSFVIVEDFFPVSFVGELREGITLLMILRLIV